MVIISDMGVVRGIINNDDPVGRSVEEVLRLIKAYQYTDTHPGEACPINWDEGIVLHFGMQLRHDVIILDPYRRRANDQGQPTREQRVLPCDRDGRDVMSRRPIREGLMCLASVLFLCTTRYLFIFWPAGLMLYLFEQS